MVEINFTDRNKSVVPFSQRKRPFLVWLIALIVLIFPKIQWNQFIQYFFFVVYSFWNQNMWLTGLGIVEIISLNNMCPYEQQLHESMINVHDITSMAKTGYIWEYAEDGWLFNTGHVCILLIKRWLVSGLVCCVQNMNNFFFVH